MSETYPRDLRGYAEQPPMWRWPGGKKLAVSVVINWEEGAEHNVLHGDDSSENGGCDVADGRPRFGARDLRTESMYNFGTRVGVWRLLDILDAYRVPASVFACGMAVERYPELAAEFAFRGHEICGHGYRWIDYHGVAEETERDHIARTVDAITSATGRRPLGWYTGRTSPNTRRLVVEHGGLLYDSDAYDDELPYWDSEFGKPHLVLPYAFDTNDMRLATTPGLATGRQFGDELIDTLDELLLGGSEAPRMMSLGLHLRLVGRPARAHAVRRFLEYASAHPDVWFARRIDIARWWMGQNELRNDDDSSRARSQRAN
ncbi:allantoinase PuuE [Gordonia sp. SL306]|uniref:allantoinase PuuE n=1 Tax=Gordonia sp. SL306 TaxID=2995145 RepID=UPI00227223F8|nr:allantoinase PuuE [Gordonia sp. SL306]WAC57535.1 allantoinase PuuE [Gordonia sp. SL306]